jgi:hypothetical protein
MLRLKPLLIGPIAAALLTIGIAPSHGVTIDVSSIANPGAAELEGTIAGPGVVEMGLSVVDFPREYAITFAMTDLHFDIPIGQVALADITVTQNLFANAKITKMEMSGVQSVWIVGDPIVPPKFIRISSEVSIDKITATPEVSALLLFASGILALSYVRLKNV